MNNHINFILSLFVPVIITIGLIPVIMRVAQRNGWLSKLDFRRRNGQQVPLLGGVSIYLGILAVSFMTSNQFMLTLSLCALPVILVGVWDDLFELDARPKFLAQVMAVGLWLAVNPVTDLLMVQTGVGEVKSILISSFWMLGIINALNMIDGMDGEASGFALIACLFLAGTIDNHSVNTAALSLGAGCAGFLIYNRPPARIYLGEAGSTFLGFSLAAMCSVLPPGQTPHLSLLLVPLFIFAFPEIDAVMSMIRRWRSSSSLFKGDHDHIHHKLQKLGFSTSISLVVIYGAAVFSGLTAWIIWNLEGHWSYIPITILSALGLCSLLFGVYFLEHHQSRQVSTYSRTLLDRFLKITDSPKIDLGNFHATVYDLLPYYKELQSRGIIEVQEFIKNFSDMVSRSHGEAQLIRYGSYTVIAVEKQGTGPMGKIEEQISEAFYTLLEHHGVKKNDTDRPWGLSFYSTSSKGEEFFRKFDLSQNSSKIQFNQIA